MHYKYIQQAFKNANKTSFFIKLVNDHTGLTTIKF